MECFHDYTAFKRSNCSRGLNMESVQKCLHIYFGISLCVLSQG